jgi:hypothetical protein
LNEDLRGKLRRLNSLRNDVAHRGYCAPPLDNDDCAELVTASLLAFRYLGHLAQTPVQRVDAVDPSEPKGR